MMDQLISPTPAAAQLLDYCMRNGVSDLHLKQMCCWWLPSSFCACNESGVIFQVAAHVWALTLEETSECKVLRKGCQQRFKEHDRRKMTAFWPRDLGDVCVHVWRNPHKTTHTSPKHTFGQCCAKVGTSKGTVCSIPSNAKPCVCTHTHTQP